MRAFLPVLAAAAVMFSGSCASVALPEREGVALYRRKCGNCHRPYAPQEHTAEEWKRRLPEMAKRAKLTPDELDTIGRYLLFEPAASHGTERVHPLPASR